MRSSIVYSQTSWSRGGTRTKLNVQRSRVIRTKFNLYFQMSPPLLAFSNVAAAMLVQLLALDNTEESRSSTHALRGGGAGSTGEEKSSLPPTSAPPSFMRCGSKGCVPATAGAAASFFRDSIRDLQFITEGVVPSRWCL